jgi:hypothetical protein
MTRQLIFLLMLVSIAVCNCGCMIESPSRGGVPPIEMMRDGLNRRLQWSHEVPNADGGPAYYYEEPTASRFKAVPTRDVYAPNIPTIGIPIIADPAPGPIPASQQPEVFAPDETIQPSDQNQNIETLPPPIPNDDTQGNDGDETIQQNSNSVLTRLNPPAKSPVNQSRETALPGWRPLRK